MGKVGRNDPCPCGSGRKFKKCHLGKDSIRSASTATPPLTAKQAPKSPEFQERARAIFAERIAAENCRKERFGGVRPIIHTEAFGHKLIAVGSRIYSTDRSVSFPEFLISYLRGTLGERWWNEEAGKPLIARHQIAQWEAHAAELARAQKPDHRGRSSIPRDGLVSAFMTLAYDLYIVRDNIKFHEGVLDRLRRRNDFVGVRYELLVAATFVRAGFQVEPEDESDAKSKHAEFLATHRSTKFAVAVEAKARNRRPSDRKPQRAGVDDLIANAAEKAPGNKPFAVFVDVAMPPEERDKPASWANEVDQVVQGVVAKKGGPPGPFDWVFFTSIPHQFGLPGSADPPKHYIEWVPRQTRMPDDIREAIVEAVRQYGDIPEFESGS
jgi:hypothetical protein